MTTNNVLNTIPASKLQALKAAGLSDAQIVMAIRFTESKGRSSKTPKECRCGCGGMTKGGVYKPGHDAKHLSNVMKGL